MEKEINGMDSRFQILGFVFLACLLIPLGAGIGLAVGYEQFTEFYVSNIETPAMESVFGAGEDSTFRFAFGKMPLVFTVSLVGLTLICTLLAFPAVFMMRVFGLFGLYCQTVRTLRTSKLQ